MHPQQNPSMADTVGILPDLALFGSDGLLNELEKSSTCSDSDFVLPASPFIDNNWQDQEVSLKPYFKPFKSVLPYFGKKEASDKSKLKWHFL